MELIEAKQYDRGMWLLERFSLTTLRRRLLAEANGRVLELGAGTGVNQAFYDPEVVVAAVDLRPTHLAAVTGKAAAAGRQAQTLVGSADAHCLPFADDSFDAVVGTLVFCSISEPLTALAEVARVLRPGGQLLLLEHVRGQTRLTRRLTDWLHPAWFAMQGECHLNRETAETVRAAGFRVEESSTHGWGVLQMIRATSP